MKLIYKALAFLVAMLPLALQNVVAQDVVTSFPYSCSFENSLWGWELETPTSVWKWKKGSNGDGRVYDGDECISGPSAAYDGNTYLYLNTESTSGSANGPEIGIVRTFDFTNLSNPILTLYAHAFYAGTGNFCPLRVYMRKVGAQSWADISTIIEQQGDKWIPVNACLKEFANAGEVELRITVEVSSLECCIAIDKITIDNFVVETTASDASCYFYSDGKITVTPNGGGPIYQYSSDGGNSFTNLTTQTTSYVFDNLESAYYTIQVKDNQSGCIAEKLEYVNQPSKIDVDITTSDIKCYGDNDGKINIFASQNNQNTGFTYSINGLDGPFVSSYDFTGLSGGEYSVVVKNSDGCYSQEENVHIGNDVILTIDDVKYTQVEGCYGDKSASILVKASFSNNGPLDYSKDGGSYYNNGESYFEGVGAGTYNIVVKDNNGCTAEWGEPIVITQPDQFVFSDSSHTDVVGCKGDATGYIYVAFEGGIQPYTYSIDGGIKFQDEQKFENLVAGTYSLRAVDAKNCKASGPSIIIAEPKQVVISSVEPQNVGTCYGDATGKITILASGGTGNLSYSLSGGNDGLQSSNQFENLSAGSYNPYVVDQMGCSVSWSEETLTQPDLFYIISSETDNNIKCNGDETALITIAATGGTSPYTFSIDNFATSKSANYGNISATFTNNGAGVYTLSARDKNGCLAGDSTITLTEPTLLTIDDVITTQVLCYGDATGEIEIVASGGTTPYAQHGWKQSTTTVDGWVNKSPQYDPVLTGLSAMTYDVHIVDANGCEAIKNNIEIMQPPILELVGDINAYSVTGCYGDETGKIQIYAKGGVEPLEYSIDNGVEFQETPIFDLLAAGTYYPYVKDANGCVLDDLDPVAINQPEQLYFINVFSTEVEGCKGESKGTISLSASGGSKVIDYSIDGGVTFDGRREYTGLPAGEYNIFIRDANREQCQLEYYANPVVIEEPEILKVDNIKVVDNVCYGQHNGSVELTISGGSTKKHSYYFYQTRDTSLAPYGTNAFGNLYAGDYSYAIRDGYNCVVYADFTITQPDEITLKIADSMHVTTCYGDKKGMIHAVATGGAGGFYYTISATGVYTNTLEADEAIWENIPAANYCVTVKDKIGCSPEEIYFTIKQVDRLNVVINTDDAIIYCNNDETAMIKMSASGGTKPYLFTVDGENFVSDSIFSNLPAGQYVFQVKDNKGCTTTEQKLNIKNPEKVTLSYEYYDITCYSENNGRIISKTTGGNNFYTYYINGVENPDGKNSGVFKNLTDGEYLISVTDGFGCSDESDIITISRPINSAGFDVSVSEGCSPLTVEIVPQNDGTVYYEIDGHRTDYYANKAVVTQVLTNNSRETQKVKILAVLQPSGSIDNCRDSAVNYVSVFPKPLVDFDINPNDTLVYPDTIAQIHLFNNVTPKLVEAHWDFGDGETSDNLDCTNENNPYADMHYYSTCGNYNIIVSASDGRCWDTVQKPFVINPRPVFVEINSDVIQGCAPLKVKFVGSAHNADSTVWNFGDSTISINSPEPSHIFETEGDYVVTYYGYGDCGSFTKTTKVIHVYVKPYAGFSQDKDTVYVGQSLNLESDDVGAYFYQWDLGDGTTSDRNEVSHQYKKAGVYDISLIVSTANSCSDTAEVKQAVKVISEPQVVFPNAFSPNGDGHNDEFKCIYLGEIASYKIVILNSKGQIVYRSEDINQGWDGKRNGAYCAPGIYLYKYKIVLKDKSFYIKNGSLVLLH